MLDLSEELRRSVDDGVTPVTVDEIFDRVERNRTRMPRWRHRRGALVVSFAVGAIAIGLTAALIIVALGGFNDGPASKRPATEPSTDNSPSLSVLDRAPTETDVVPTPGGALGVDSTVLVPGSLRMAVSDEGWHAFVARAAAGVDGDYCTLVLTPVSNERTSWSVSSGCAHVADLAEDGANLLRYPDDGSGRGAIVGFVPDGTLAVEVDGSKAVLGENAFVIRGIDPRNPVDVTIVSNEGTRSIVVPPPLLAEPGRTGSLRVERTRIVGNGPLAGGTERVVIEFNEPLPVDEVEYVAEITSLDRASGIVFTTQGPATTHVCDSVHSVPEGAVGSVDLLIPANWFADDRAHAGPPPETVDAPAKFVVCGPHNGFIQFAVWAPLSADPADVTVTVSPDRTSLTILTSS